MRMFRTDLGGASPSAIVFTILLAVWACSAGAQDQAAGARKLTLDDCIGIALENSPTLLISQERLHIAGKDVTAAKGAFLPDVSVGRNWSKSERTDFDVQQYVSYPDTFITVDSDDDETAWLTQLTLPAGVADQSVSSTYKDFNGRASLNLFGGFGKFANLGAARSARDAAEASLGYTRETVIQSVVTAYFNLLRYQELAKVAGETREQAAKELERTETYFRLGSAAKSDVLQQRVRLENTRLDVVVAENNIQKAFADLAYVMNQPLAETFAIDASVLDTDFAIEDVESLYGEALHQRLDLKSSEHSLEASRKNVTSASSNLWPQVNLSASYTRYKNESPYRFGAQESSSFGYGYSVSWNVFDRLQTLTARSKAKANARIAEYELDQARLNAQVEVRQLHNSLIESRERASVSRETIEQSMEELRLAQERFRVGAGTTLDVIMAQVNLANSRAQEVQAKCDYLIYKSQLDRAVGRTAWNR